MVNAKRLAQMVKKWQRMAALGRERLTWTTDECCTSPSVAVEGHFVVYTTDGGRFEVPLPYVDTAIVGELLRMSHDEFGYATHGKITLPCEAAVMEYVLCLLRRNASEEVERALLTSVFRPCHYGNGLEPSMGLSGAVSSF